MYRLPGSYHTNKNTSSQHKIILNVLFVFFIMLILLFIVMFFINLTVLRSHVDNMFLTDYQLFIQDQLLTFKRKIREIYKENTYTILPSHLAKILEKLQHNKYFKFLSCELDKIYKSYVFKIYSKARCITYLNLNTYVANTVYYVMNISQIYHDQIINHTSVKPHYTFIHTLVHNLNVFLNNNKKELLMLIKDGKYRAIFLYRLLDFFDTSFQPLSQVFLHKKYKNTLEALIHALILYPIEDKELTKDYTSVLFNKKAIIDLFYQGLVGDVYDGGIHHIQMFNFILNRINEVNIFICHDQIHKILLQMYGHKLTEQLLTFTQLYMYILIRILNHNFNAFG